jgi:hypothetical protein
MTRLILVLAFLAGCASLPEGSLAERLVGSWHQRVSILGEEKESILTLRADGSFVELGRTRRKSASVAHVPLRGTWRLAKDQLELAYASGPSNAALPQVEQKTVLALSESQFAYRDTLLGVHSIRTRVDREAP